MNVMKSYGDQSLKSKLLNPLVIRQLQNRASRKELLTAPHWGMPKRSSNSPSITKKKKQPTSINLLTAQIAGAPVNKTEEDLPQKEKPLQKNPAAVALGRLGGLKGGKARAEKLTPKKRS